MAFDRVNHDDPLHVSPDTWNALMEMLETYRSGALHKKSSVTPATPIQTTVVQVYNSSTTATIEKFRAIDLGDGPLVTPTQNLTVFTNRPICFKGKPCTSSTRTWGILMDTLAPKQIGRVVVSGMCLAWIDVTGTGDTAVTATADIPTSGGSGSEIVWVQGGAGSATTTGAQYALLNLGASGANRPFIGKIVKDGGSDGNAYSGTPATWTYTIYDQSGNIIATKVPVQKARTLAVSTTPGTLGLIAYVPEGSSVVPGGYTYHTPVTGSSSSEEPYQGWALWEADEVYYQANDCVPGTGELSSGE